MEYKFRVWSKKHNKMIYFDLSELLVRYNDEDDYCRIADTDLFNIHQDIDIDDVMQSIGIEDRNGKDIFCGDILRVESSDTGTVVEGRGGFVIKFDNSHRLSFEDVASENIEIIGNAMMHSEREHAINVIFDGFTEEELQSEETQQARVKLLAMPDEEFSAECLRIAKALVARHSPLSNMFSWSGGINAQELWRFPVKGNEAKQ